MITGHPHTSQQKPQQTNTSSYNCCAQSVCGTDLLVANASLNREKRRSRKRKVFELAHLLREYLNTHAYSHTQMWGYLFWMSRKCSLSFMTQTHIGKRGNVLRPQANINLHKMQDSRLLFIYNRGVKKTCTYQLPALCNDPLFMQEISDLFPWLSGYVYRLKITSRFNDQQSNRTQVLNSNSKRAYHQDMTLRLRVTSDKLTSFPDRASPLPGALAHEPPINQEFLKGEDYERFARSIGAKTEW